MTDVTVGTIATDDTETTGMTGTATEEITEGETETGIGDGTTGIVMSGKGTSGTVEEARRGEGRMRAFRRNL